MDFEKSVDVLVVGGGIAGVAAAVEATRSGASVAMLEKTVFSGGLATTGLVDIYLPLCDGHGTQVMFGLVEELLHVSLKYGPGRIPESWRNPDKKPERERLRARFSAASFILALDELLVAEGVDIWYDTLACLPVVEKGSVVGVEVENKSGRGLFRAGCVVDASGDADIARRAGAKVHEGSNHLSAWALAVDRARTASEPVDSDAARMDESIRVGGEANGKGNPGNARKFVGMDGKQVTDLVLMGRELLRERMVTRQTERGENGRFEVYPVTLPAMAQFRTTIAVTGLETLEPGGEFRHADDSIGLSCDWRKAGPVWEIPYGALVPETLNGVITAGRCISSIDDAWQVTRVIPPAALTGQAAGAAAAMAARDKRAPRDVPVADLQEHLKNRGVRLHLEDIGLSPA